MTCPDRELELNALVDGELDPQAARALAAHVAGCPDCAAGLAGLLALRAELAALAPPGPAPEALRRRIENSLPPSPAATTPDQGWWTAARGRRNGRTRAGAAARGGIAGFAAGLATAAVLAFALFAPPRGGEERETLTALAASVHRADLPRSLLAPTPGTRAAARGWFAAQGLATPPAPDLAAEGFRFTFYRGDLVAGHRTAVLGYQHTGQPVTLFAWPSGHGEPAHPPRTARSGGMTVVYWNDGNTEFWAVGAQTEAVAAFVAAYRRAV